MPALLLLRYEGRLAAEREAGLRLKGENGIMKKKFGTLQKEIDDQRAEVAQLFEHKKELYAVRAFMSMGTQCIPYTTFRESCEGRPLLSHLQAGHMVAAWSSGCLYLLHAESAKHCALVYMRYGAMGQAMTGLERDVVALKREVSERDDTIGDKEKRIHDLKRKNQELEKFKFVLDYKIKELKRQIEPREAELARLKEQIQARTLCP